MSDYEIDAVPVRYHGVTFRSSLEARWACLFDLVNLHWRYEPCLLGNWQPDFLLERWFVEVKPVHPSGFSMAFDEYERFRKAIRSEPTILLGNGPGESLGCMTVATDQGHSSMTVFFDPSHPNRIRAVGGDGADDRCRGNLREPWSRCAPILRGESERVEQNEDRTARRGSRSSEGRRALSTRKRTR